MVACALVVPLRTRLSTDMARQVNAKAMEEEGKKQIMFMLLEESRVWPLFLFFLFMKINQTN